MGKYLIKKLNEDFKFIVDEQLVRGTRKKILSITNDKKLAMFKYEQYDCSESCSEKMAYEIALVLGYDCAKIDLACDDSGTLGVLNYYFVNNHDTFHTDIVAYLNKNSKDKKNYYTISNIKSVLDEIDNSLFNSFIKIIIFDALIGEQDRHEENWGILEKNGKYYVSPLYDNGDSLLKDFKNPIFADLYYSEKRSFDSYIRKSKTLIYKEDNKTKYKHFELVKFLYDNYPDIVKNEISNLNKLTDDNICNIVNSIPDGLLTNEHKKYIILYLIKRRDLILNIKEGD